MADDCENDDLENYWYTVFELHHTDTVKEVEEFYLEDPSIHGELPFLEADLDRVITRAREVDAWLQQFQSYSGNSLSVIALVCTWPAGDCQQRPRLVTTYWSGYGAGSEDKKRTDAVELINAFERAPLESPIMDEGGCWEYAFQALGKISGRS